MYRRRRIAREKIAFSFDSFLDVVANVIGIIIKLILVTWVGARSYTATMAFVEGEPASTPTLQKPLPQMTDDPLHGEVQRNVAELDEARSRLLAQLRQLEDIDQRARQSENELGQLSKSRLEIDRHRQAVEALLTDESARLQLAHLSLAELQKRGQELIARLQEVEKQPTPQKVLRYHTPVSRTVGGDEIFFECKGGKITFIDLPAFLHDIQGGIDGVAAELRTRSKIERHTGQVGAFRLRYFYEKEEGLGGSFRYGVTGWELEPVIAERGETLQVALTAGSDFRRLTDSVDANQTVVTFWVYPDSFELFRHLRDILYEREIEVAGRPLPMGAAIAGSRNGTRSRGQ